jgi:hypothetical protein
MAMIDKFRIKQEEAKSFFDDSNKTAWVGWRRGIWCMWFCQIGDLMPMSFRRSFHKLYFRCVAWCLGNLNSEEEWASSWTESSWKVGIIPLYFVILREISSTRLLMSRLDYFVVVKGVGVTSHRSQNTRPTQHKKIIILLTLYMSGEGLHEMSVAM